jgi:hypothetical protein
MPYLAASGIKAFLTFGISAIERFTLWSIFGRAVERESFIYITTNYSLY